MWVGKVSILNFSGLQKREEQEHPDSDVDTVVTKLIFLVLLGINHSQWSWWEKGNTNCSKKQHCCGF